MAEVAVSPRTTQANASSSSPVAVKASRIPIAVRSPQRPLITSSSTTTQRLQRSGSLGNSAEVTTAITTSSTTSVSVNGSRVPAATQRVSSGSSSRRSTLPQRVSSGGSSRNGSSSSGGGGVILPPPTRPSAAAVLHAANASNPARRTLPSTSSDATTPLTAAAAANGATKRLSSRSSSSTTTTTTVSAAAATRAKKATLPSSSTATTTTTGMRSLGSVMGGGKHVDPAQRRARKAAKAAAEAASANEGGEGEGKVKSKVARGELFYPYGRCRYALTAGDSLGSIRAALNKHGWKELKDPNAVSWDLFWSISSRALQPAKMKPNQICNHFQANGCITTKIGLGRNTRKVSGHVDTFFPRCFIVSEPKEFELFEKQYQIQAAVSVVLRYLSLAEATTHAKDAAATAAAAAAVPALMTPTVVWLAMLAIRGHCRKLATALAADANWTPLKRIHARDPIAEAMLDCYEFATPPDDASTASSATSASATPGATHKRRSELDRSEWKLVVKCAESFSGISKLPLVARSKADMERLPAADPAAPPPLDPVDDDDGNDNDNEDASPSAAAAAGTPLAAQPSAAVSTTEPIAAAVAPKAEAKTKAKRVSGGTSKDGGISGKKEGKTATSKTKAKSSAADKTAAPAKRRTAATTKSRDPVWEENINSGMFSSRTIREALSTVRELRQVDPQFLFNGEHNVWILKPGGKSRGRGIQCFDTLLSINNYMKKDHKDKWVAQKYLERPLTVFKKKFDIRQWVFVTQFGSCLRLWFYDDCYVRFSSQDFDLTDLSPAIHLTNNSIQGKLADFDTLEFDAKGNMWSSQRFEEFLEANFSLRPVPQSNNGHEAKEEKEEKSPVSKTIWMERLRPRMKQIARYAIECGYGRMKYRSHTFELFGLDYMLDENLTPWLLEVNSSPTLCHIAVEGIVERMTYDLFCVLFAEHQRYFDEEGGRDKIAAQSSVVLERKKSSPSTAPAASLPATTDTTSASDVATTDTATTSVDRPPASTAGLPIGSCMRGSKWELINELRLATRPGK